MKNYSLVALGGVIGVLLRYGCIELINATAVLFVVNIVGSFFMGILNGYFERKPHAELKLLLTTGMLGSFTTFSSFSADWLHYFETSPLVALTYTFIMTISCIVVAFFGYSLMKEGATK